MKTIRSSVLAIGNRYGSERVYIEGDYLDISEFTKGSKYTIQYGTTKITLFVDENGNRKVSGKKFPVIDINNKKIGEIFPKQKEVNVIVKVGKIIIQKTVKVFRQIACEYLPKTFGTIFAGGGVMDQAAENSGYKSLWAIESNKKYADIWQKNHSGTMYNSCISEVDFSKLEKVELLIGGIPCEPFSIVRHNRKEDEVHPTLDLALQVMMLVGQNNIPKIVLEEVPGFVKSDIGKALIQALKRHGYNVVTKIISGKDFGELTERKRVVIVASYKDYSFPDSSPAKRKLKEVLQPYDDPTLDWFTEEDKKWLFEHNRKQKAKGNHFQAKILTEDTEIVPAITKRYQSIQGSNPILQHPKDPKKFRLLTNLEVSRIMGLPKDYDLGTAKNTAGEVLGQGILVRPFEKIISALV